MGCAENGFVGGILINRSNNPATIVGSDLTNICRATGAYNTPRICKVRCNVRNILRNGFISLSAILNSGVSVRLLGHAPSDFLNDYHRGLPSPAISRGPFIRLFRLFQRGSVNTIFCVNNGSSVSAVSGLDTCNGAIGDRVHFVNMPGAVSGSLVLASRAPNCNDTTGCVTAVLGRIVYSSDICSLHDIAITRVVNHRAN